MTKYEVIFYICCGSLLLFLTNAEFQNIVWEFGYFYSYRVAWLFVAYLMYERSKNLYEEKISNRLKILFFGLLGWEGLATYSWSLANSELVLKLLLIFVLSLIGSLFFFVDKNGINESRKQRHRK